MPKKILIVDDEENLVELLRVNLLAAGYRVITASSGEEGLAAVAKELPDALLLDCRLPGLDGITVCRRIREDPRTCALPILFISAATQKEDMEKAFCSGGTAYIKKPFNPLSVLGQLKSLLGDPAP